MRNRGSGRSTVKETASAGSVPKPRRTPPVCTGIRPARLAALLAAAVLATACGNVSRPTATSPLGQFLRGTTQEPTTLAPEVLRAPTSCPQVRIQPGTEAIRVTEPGTQFEEGALRYQARIDRTARECTPAEGRLGVRVGVAGRALSGPKGAPGAIRLPVRIAVREGDEVVYSKLHTVTVTLTDAAPSQEWAMVDEEVVVSSADTATIIVGFDEGGR